MLNRFNEIEWSSMFTLFFLILIDLLIYIHIFLTKFIIELKQNIIILNKNYFKTVF